MKEGASAGHSPDGPGEGSPSTCGPVLGPEVLAGAEEAAGLGQSRPHGGCARGDKEVGEWVERQVRTPQLASGLLMPVSGSSWCWLRLV